MFLSSGFLWPKHFVLGQCKFPSQLHLEAQAVPLMWWKWNRVWLATVGWIFGVIVNGTERAYGDPRWEYLPESCSVLLSGNRGLIVSESIRRGGHHCFPVWPSSTCTLQRVFPLSFTLGVTALALILSLKSLQSVTQKEVKYNFLGKMSRHLFFHLNLRLSWPKYVVPYSNPSVCYGPHNVRALLCIPVVDGIAEKEFVPNEAAGKHLFCSSH